MAPPFPCDGLWRLSRRAAAFSAVPRRIAVCRVFRIPRQRAGCPSDGNMRTPCPKCNKSFTIQA